MVGHNVGTFTGGRSCQKIDRIMLTMAVSWSLALVGVALDCLGECAKAMNEAVFWP